MAEVPRGGIDRCLGIATPIGGDAEASIVLLVGRCLSSSDVLFEIVAHCIAFISNILIACS